MKILHIIAGLPCAGGMSELVPLLALEQYRLGNEVTVATVGRIGAATALQAELAGVHVVRYRSCWPHSLYYSLEMHRKLGTWVMNADLVHVHGCWTFPVWWACHCALKHHKPYVRSPHGCLDLERLKISAWKKRLAGWFFDRRYFAQAAVIHATAASEVEGIRNYLTCESALVEKTEDGRPRTEDSICATDELAYPRIVVLPNGVDAKAFNGHPDQAELERRWPECRDKHIVLFLSRLHPIKGIDLLVSAWACVLNQQLVIGRGVSAVGGDRKNEDGGQRTESGGKSLSLISHPAAFHNWHLMIAGPDESGCQASTKKVLCDEGIASRVTFCGPLYGEDKYGVMATASLFVLPTRNENFGIVVAEALACGVPVITTKGAPWSELLGNSDSSFVHYCDSASVGEVGGRRAEVGGRKAEVLPTNERMNSRTNELARSGRAGWWIEIGVEPLAKALKEAMGLTDEERRAMGENGRRLVEAKYQWPMIAKEMEKVYGGICTW